MNVSQILVFGLALSCVAFTAANATEETGTMLARGKDLEIRRSQLDEAWAIYAAKMSRGGQLPDEPRDSVETKLLNHIIETQILLRKATESEKTKGQADADRMLNDSRKRFATEADFAAWLKQMGMAPEVYRRRMIEQRICELVIDREIGPAIQITDEQLKNYYNENAAAFDRPAQCRGRQILFSTLDPKTHEPLPEAEQKAKEKLANEVKARLERGEDFFKLYKEFSEEPWAKEEQSGDEMLYVKGQMPPEFDAAAFSLKTNQVSDVVRSRLGYSIIRVSEIQPAGRLPLPEVAPRLKGFLVDEEIKKRLPDFLTKLRKEAAVEILSRQSASPEEPKPLSASR
jgi:peptidyl-prolyl cis-trans isomerase C